jgi:histidine ammonia-lyase
VETLGKEARMGQGTAAAYELIRSKVPFIEADTVMYPYIEIVRDMVASGELLHAVQARLGCISKFRQKRIK